jgi:Dyp-type peroxidase family
MTALELNDIQGNILRGYRLPHVAHLFGTISQLDPKPWRTALRKMPITCDAGSSKPEVAWNVGISHAGMTLLAPDLAENLKPFEAYASGMRVRSPLLGDPGDVPWDAWQARHVWIAVHAACSASLRHEVSRLRDTLGELLTSSALFGDALVDEQGHWHEPFGFRDDISHPAIAGAPGATVGGGGRWDRKQKDWFPIAAGEFLLGYPNEGGINVLERSLRTAPLLQNGTFAVFRELVQDVRQFKQTVNDEATRCGVTKDTLQAKLIGRYPSGKPLAKVASPGEVADFTYEDDSDGIQCPIGAHVRRANPRVSGEHRIIRRGMPYRRMGDEGDASDPGVEGIYFVAFNASIENQFEFIQSTWFNRSAGALPGSRDPLVGETLSPVGGAPGTRRMLIEGDAHAQRDPIISSLPPFVTCRGGEYYFMPGLRGLRQLAGA